MKAKIILGLTEIKAMHQNIVQDKNKAAKESNKTDLIFFFRTQTSGLEILKKALALHCIGLYGKIISLEISKCSLALHPEALVNTSGQVLFRALGHL